MIRRRKIPEIIVILAIAAILFRFFLRSEEGVILGIFDDVAETFNCEQNQSPFDNLSRAQKLCGFIVPENFRFRVDDTGDMALMSRKEGVRIVAFACRGRRLQVEFSDLDVFAGTFDAVIRGKVDFSGCDASFALGGPKARAFIAHMKKIDGDWLFSEVVIKSAGNARETPAGKEEGNDESESVVPGGGRRARGAVFPDRGRGRARGWAIAHNLQLIDMIDDCGR